MIIREEDPKKAKRIIKQGSSKKYTELLVQLILNVSAGHKESEKFLSDKLIADIQYLESAKDEFFINGILLPLIRNE
jgi:hypothetical protein